MHCTFMAMETILWADGQNSVAGSKAM